MTKLLQWLVLRCGRGCGSVAVGVYWMNRGCACDARKVQRLCSQHVVSLEPIDSMKCLLKIWPLDL